MTRTLPDAILVAKGEQIVVERHDAPLRIRGRALTVEQELGPKPVIEHPQPRAIDVLVDLAVLFMVAVLMFAAVGMTVYVFGQVLP